MALYEVLSPVHKDGTRFLPDEFIELDDEAAAALIACGAVRATEVHDFSGFAEDLGGDGSGTVLPPVSIGVRTAGPLVVDVTPLPTKTDLARYNKEKLIAQAKAEGVTIDGTASNKAIMGAILAARLAS